ncbi:DUF4167 domain-containing protein [Alteraurantiacibacter palmitatis]|uniref:DUF4167 domain-containing protein n=1 Tax=Alteraurantiacibacter palmitatis TaxID=2054628 RepID=A0ABV7E8A2_9SPHN
MNNQRNNNNRRRGRGSNRGGGNGGNQGNRIDSRARGNAPQMLEKYRKLAHEASLNDDRVQTEYYLQFADHYFRVIADGRAQKDDGRPPRRENEQSGFETDDFDDERDFGREDSQGSNREGGRDNSRDDRPRDDRQPRQNRPRRQDGEGEAPAAREDGEAHAPRAKARSDEGSDTPLALRPGAEGDADDGDNPFLAKPRRKPRRRKDGDEGEDASGGSAIDPGLLPPAIGRGAAEPEAEEAPAIPAAAEAEDDGEAKPRRRLRMPRARSGDEEELAAVG